MFEAPNSFIQFWKASELRKWLEELSYRDKTDAWNDFLSVPTKKQTEEECRRRRLRGFK